MKDINVTVIAAIYDNENEVNFKLHEAHYTKNYLLNFDTNSTPQLGAKVSSTTSLRFTFNIKV